MKKSIFKILISLTVFGIVGFFYITRYISIKPASDKFIFYNPFEIDEIEFRDDYRKALGYKIKGDTAKANKFFKKAIQYRGTYNEITRENLYSCGNGLWKHKQDKLLKFSICYENLGMVDSAMSCLEPALYNFEKHHFSTEKRFFELAIAKYGKRDVLVELSKSIKTTEKLACFMCSDFSYEFKGIKIGLDKNDLEIDTDLRFDRLVDRYEM